MSLLISLLIALIAFLSLWFPLLLVLKWVGIICALLFMTVIVCVVKSSYRILVFLACFSISLGTVLSWTAIENRLGLLLYWYGAPETTFLDRMLGLVVAIACGFTVAVVLLLILGPMIDSTNSEAELDTDSLDSHRGSYQDLIQLLHGDHAAAARLIAQARQRNPHESDHWITSKVVRDLERDRR
jgi:hypothetical protein